MWPGGQGLSFLTKLPTPPIKSDSGSTGHRLGTLTELVEEEGILVLLHVLRGAGLVQEE